MCKKSKGRSGQSDLCNKRWQNDFACLDFNWEYDSWSGKDQAQEVRIYTYQLLREAVNYLADFSAKGAPPPPSPLFP